MRFFKILIVTLLAFSLFTGCVARDPKYITLEKKSSPYQYSNEVYKNVRYENDFYLEVFDNNMYKTYPVDASDTDILVSFFESLNNDSYVTEYDLTDLEVQYKLIVNFNKSDFSEKYVFNIYDNNFVTLYPWDGNLTEDMIVMTDIPRYNNLYDYCIYIVNKAHKNN